jgi:hypothetical protein
MRSMTLLILSSLFISCASFSMGPRRSCESPELPTKPITHSLLARPGSTGIFAGQIVDLENYVCVSPDDSKAKEIWIRDVLRACGN